MPALPLPAVITAVAPARGTALTDIAAAGVVALVAGAVVFVAGALHRRRGLAVLHAASRISRKVAGLPGWAGVPLAVTTTSLLVAVFGFYWDVSWHIDRGRDPGPFANPAHWFIIVGLAGIALGGIVAVVLGDDPTPTSVRLTSRWHAPVGGILLSVCGLVALMGFPLDDVWHRLFGQDVTLWGPTHIQMVGGASLATLALWVLVVEGLRAGERAAQPGPLGWVAGHQQVLLGGAFLLGLSTLQGEFDFGVPQFRQVFHPVLIMVAASVALTAARIRGGKGAALSAAAFFIVLRGTLTVLIGPVLGRSTLHFPLYLAEAAVVEFVAARLGTDRQVRLGVWSGIGIGTVGLAAEWAWSHVWMPLPWHQSMAVEGVAAGLVAAVAGGVVGGLTGRALVEGVRRPPAGRWTVATAWSSLFLVFAVCLPMTAPTNLTADVQLLRPDGRATPDAIVSLRPHPDGAVRGANWFVVTSWQGEPNGSGGLDILTLHHQADGAYVTARPVPTIGSWKTIVRLQKGPMLASLPIYLPPDPGIPVNGVFARPSFEARFLRDKTVLQREAVGGSNGLQRAAYAVLAALAVVWIAVLSWGLRRLQRGGDPDGRLQPAVTDGRAAAWAEAAGNAAGVSARPPVPGSRSTG